MALDDSQISIINQALRYLGEPPIVSLQDNSSAATTAAALYDPARRYVLRLHPWQFAAKRAQLAAAPTPPAFGYGAAFPVPADFLRVIELPDMAATDRWKTEGGSILCNGTAPLNLVYVCDLQDPTQFDSLFVRVLAYQLAGDMAPTISQEQSRQQAMYELAQATLDAERLVDSQSQAAPEYDDDVWLRARRTGLIP